jgi:hypothetical protein
MTMDKQTPQLQEPEAWDPGVLGKYGESEATRRHLDTTIPVHIMRTKTGLLNRAS